MRLWIACSLSAALVLAMAPAGLRAQAPASQPAATATPSVPIEAVRKAFDKALLAAQTAAKPNSLAGNTQAMAEYRKAQNLANRFPDLGVTSATLNDINKKITDLQGKIAQQAKTQRAAAVAKRRQTAAVAAAGGRGGARGGGSPVIYGGRRSGGFAGGTVSRGGGGVRVGAAACPPGAVRTGST